MCQKSSSRPQRNTKKKIEALEDARRKAEGGGRKGDKGGGVPHYVHLRGLVSFGKDVLDPSSADAGLADKAKAEQDEVALGSRARHAVVCGLFGG